MFMTDQLTCGKGLAELLQAMLQTKQAMLAAVRSGR
jgi:hypothetical protein